MKPYIIATIILVVLLAGCLKPLYCPDTSEPVCGADGKTYKNTCLAKQAGVEAAHQGACEVAPAACSDSDGGKDIFTAGKVTDKNGVTEDSCKDSQNVNERYCENNLAAASTFPCPSGFECQSGKCASVPCTDSDNGSDKAVKGTTTLGASTETDACVDASKVTEFYCSEGQIASKEISCGSESKCVNGACVDAAEVCEDSDNGKNTSTVGTVTKGDNSNEDSCYNATTVKEYYCDDTGAIKYEKIACDSDSRCIDGKCTEEICTDSDNGKTIATKGTTSYRNVTNNDTCYSTTAVIEYYCGSDNTVQSERMNCGTGKECSNGACKTPECQNSTDDIDESDVRYQVAAFTASKTITLYEEDAIEVTGKMMLELSSVSATEATFKLYETYEDYLDGDELCSETIAAAATLDDLCGENTGTLEVEAVEDTDGYADFNIEKAYAVQYYSAEGSVLQWTGGTSCPEAEVQYGSFTADFYPYLDTETSGLNLEGKKFKMLAELAEITDIGSDTITFDMAGDEYELEDGDTFEYMNEEYEIALTFNDAGLTKIEVEPS